MHVLCCLALVRVEVALQEQLARSDDHRHWRTQIVSQCGRREVERTARFVTKTMREAQQQRLPLLEVGRLACVDASRVQLAQHFRRKRERWLAGRARAHATSLDRSRVAMRRYNVARPIPSSLAALPTLPCVARS